MRTQYSKSAENYQSVHRWLKDNYSNEKIKCEHCGVKDCKLEWANISKEYKKDREDFKVLCVLCHRRYDCGEYCNQGHLLSEPNLYTSTTRPNNRICRFCSIDNTRRARNKKTRAGTWLSHITIDC